MKKITYAFFACATAMSSMNCKKETAAPAATVEPDFVNALKMSASYDPQTQMLVVKIQLLDGFHAYALGEKTGRPVHLVVKETNGWLQMGDAVMPPGQEKVLASLGKSLVLEGAFTASVKVSGGKGPIDGELSIQICTDNFCDRPRVHPFIVSVPAENAR